MMRRFAALSRAGRVSSSLSLVDMYLGRGPLTAKPKLDARKDLLHRASPYLGLSVADNLQSLELILRSGPELRALKAQLSAEELNSKSISPSGDWKSPLQLACELSQVMAANNLECAVGGSLAMSMWAVPQFTEDVEMHIFLSDQTASIANLLDVLETAGAVVMDRPLGSQSVTKAAANASLQQSNQVNLMMDGCHVSIFLDSTEVLKINANQRKVKVDANGTEMSVMDAETIAAYKLIWQRDVDMVDLKQLFAVRGDRLDIGHIQAMLLEMEFGELDDPFQLLKKLQADFVGKHSE